MPFWKKSVFIEFFKIPTTFDSVTPLMRVHTKKITFKKKIYIYGCTVILMK